MSPQRVIHIVYFQDTHLCNKQGGETKKGESIALWSGTEVLVISYLCFSLFQIIASDKHGLFLQL